MNGAKRLIANNDGAPRAKPAKDESDKEKPAPARVRRSRPAQATALDAEALIRGRAGKLQAHGAAEANELREAMRRAIRILSDAVGA